MHTSESQKITWVLFTYFLMSTVNSDILLLSHAVFAYYSI